MTTDLKSATALIVGASRGLGYGLVERFLERGWRVIATERRNSSRPALRQLAGKNSRLSIENVDIDKEEEIAALRTRLANRQINLLMINAGVAGDATSSFQQQLMTVMRTNVGGAMAAVRALSPLVLADGVVAVMSSGLASISANTDGGWEPYRSSKAALNQSLRSFAAEMRDAPWSLTAVAPGWVKTDMGGPEALLDVATSTGGVADMLLTRFGQRGLAFLNYRGETLGW
jgi:NAD(P)-dependent dehydrogenase (short-subunit alcohol dehydrogenase family)